MKKEYIKPFLWGGAVGAIVLLIIIFSAGWVVNSSSAQMKAEKMVVSALMNRLAPISVAQFMLDPNKEERLGELRNQGPYGGLYFGADHDNQGIGGVLKIASDNDMQVVQRRQNPIYSNRQGLAI
jgi:hypothetical protein